VGRPFHALTFALLALALLSSPAFADVRIDGDRARLDAKRLEELVALELGKDAPRVANVTVTVHDGRSEVDVEVDGEHRTAAVALDRDVEPERAIALFVAELARGTVKPERVEPSVAPNPVSLGVHAVDRTSKSSSSPSPRPLRFAILGAMGARVTTTRGHLLATPHLELGVARENIFRLGGTIRYAYASADDVLGTVDAHLISGGLAGTLVLTSGSIFALATGPRVELGVAAGRGKSAGDGPTIADSTIATTFDAAWALELHSTLGGAALVGILEGGSYLRGVELHADTRDVLHLSGAFAGLSVGIRL
jgi:hypothetical protein